MSRGPMRGKRYDGGCSCCGGNQSKERAAEKRDWGIEVADEVDAEIADDLRVIADSERAAWTASRTLVI